MNEKFNTTSGTTIEIEKEDIKCYRGTEDNNCMIYLKDETHHEVAASFEEVDEIFNL